MSKWRVVYVSWKLRRIIPATDYTSDRPRDLAEQVARDLNLCPEGPEESETAVVYMRKGNRGETAAWVVYVDTEITYRARPVL